MFQASIEKLFNFVSETRHLKQLDNKELLTQDDTSWQNDTQFTLHSHDEFSIE